MSDLDLIANEKIIENAEDEDKEEIKRILTEYENFKKEVENQINDPKKNFLEIKCNWDVLKGSALISSKHQEEIKIPKGEIKKIEYFKGYTSAVRIELQHKVYFINAAVNDLALIKYAQKCPPFV